MDTVHDSQAFISHHLNMLERPSTPGNTVHCFHWGGGETPQDITLLRCVALFLREHHQKV